MILVDLEHRLKRSRNVLSTMDRSRGQLILIGGLALALVIVGLALIVNSAIYIENLASRQDTVNNDVTKYRTNVLNVVSESIEYIKIRRLYDFTGVHRPGGIGHLGGPPRPTHRPHGVTHPLEPPGFHRREDTSSKTPSVRIGNHPANVTVKTPRPRLNARKR